MLHKYEPKYSWSLYEPKLNSIKRGPCQVDLWCRLSSLDVDWLRKKRKKKWENWWCASALVQSEEISKLVLKQYYCKKDISNCQKTLYTAAPKPLAFSLNFLV